MEGLIEGRIVHYVMPNGKHNPAVLVRIWNDNGLSNLQVITDGSNDLPWPDTAEEKQKYSNCGISLDDIHHGHIWKTSISFSDKMEPNTWHWIERA